MPQTQIILLPKQRYYEWVVAARDSSDGYGRDIVQWFKDTYPSIRLDVISVNTPNDLKNTLTSRVTNNTQFAIESAPFQLRWPTDYPKIVQPFGVNPDIYRRYGLPGHEGLDIRAPFKANVYAAADGTVFQVNAEGKLSNGTVHAYGAFSTAMAIKPSTATWNGLQ
jgi:murein DD-endopeptidase MepM/ murein hydrolase activator NlpD